MTFDFTQQPPKPETLAENHKLIERLWTLGRHATEKRIPSEQLPINLKLNKTVWPL